VNSKQVLAAVSVVVLVVILVYPSVSTGTVSVSVSSSRIEKADHVYLIVGSVWAHPQGQANSSGWRLISNQTDKIDLVTLENSSRLLATGQIPAGAYDSIRIEVSNVTWVFNKTTSVVGIASPEIDGSLDFNVGAGKASSILITLYGQQETIANSPYFTGTMNATLTE